MEQILIRTRTKGSSAAAVKATSELEEKLFSSICQRPKWTYSKVTAGWDTELM